jgi:SAM-dependent methyltransferase
MAIRALAYRWMYDLTYRLSKPGWERDVVPPQVASLIMNSGSSARALDLGCGSGMASIFLAQHGLSVVGVDYSPKAIGLARQRAEQAGAAVDFRIADVTRLDFLRDPYDVGLDIGCLHNLDRARRVRYAGHLARLTRPGSTYLLWAFDHGAHCGAGLALDQARQEFAPFFALSHTEHATFRQSDSTWYWFIRQ